MDRKSLGVAVVVLVALAGVAQVAFTPDQQKQFAKCTAAAEKVYAENRTLLALAKGPEFSPEKLKLQVPKLQQAYMGMHEQHKALVEPLEGTASKAVEARKRVMDQACMRIRASLKELELLAAVPAPDAKKVTQQAEVIDRALQEWTAEHRRVGEDLGAAK